MCVTKADSSLQDLVRRLAFIKPPLGSAPTKQAPPVPTPTKNLPGKTSLATSVTTIDHSLDTFAKDCDPERNADNMYDRFML